MKADCSSQAGFQRQDKVEIQPTEVAKLYKRQHAVRLSALCRDAASVFMLRRAAASRAVHSTLALFKEKKTLKIRISRQMLQSQPITVRLERKPLCIRRAEASSASSSPTFHPFNCLILWILWICGFGAARLSKGSMTLPDGGGV